ncbi:DUF4373 domain-containing protein [Virgibacillus salexigens]|uniref:DUF4373 domain-containing protein n=1 Tax=Virgibacillus salexigens TaxID=61016 RepID=UPI00190E3C41|nr:DUF4373 domain-containing protein [Virgibacillus salexigens]
MARPNKQGVDYFPLDVHLDDKFKFIEIKYKLEGFAIVVKLMQRIYSQGYWCKWTEDELILFSDEIKADHELVQNVVNECLKRDVFDNSLYEQHNILTSKGIQKRYKEIVRRRKDVDTAEEYLLIDGNFGVNDDINPSPRQQNDDKSTQSKVKESKVNKNKEDNTIRDLFNHYLSKNIIQHQKLTDPMRRAIRGRLKDYSYAQLIQAIDNYEKVLNSNNHWFSHKYPLADLMRDKDIRKFLDEADPLNNFLSNGSRKQRKQIDLGEFDLDD